MRIFKKHQSLHVHKYWSDHTDIFSAIGGLFFGSVTNGLLFAVLPIFAASVLGGEIKAGILVSVLTLVQALFFDPLGGRMADKYGALFTMRFSLVLEVLGAIGWIFWPNIFYQLVFFLGYLARLSFYTIYPYILQKGKRKEGGLLFGIHDEIKAFGVFVGVLLLPFFVTRESWNILPYISIVFISINFLFLLRIKEAKKIPKKKQKSLLRDLNPLPTIRSALHFIQKNHQFPLFVIGSSLFEGIFYGSIWFLFPLHLAKLIANSDSSFSLGIYEITTFVFAAVVGLMADRLNWRKMEMIAWTMMLILIWIMPFWHSIYALIGLGFFIGLANNFFAAAGAHALMQFDNDHAEDGQFAAFSRMVTNLGYTISPVICGILYQFWGFQVSLFFLATVITLLAMWMLSLTLKIQPTLMQRVVDK